MGTLLLLCLHVIGVLVLVAALVRMGIAGVGLLVVLVVAVANEAVVKLCGGPDLKDNLSVQYVEC